MYLDNPLLFPFVDPEFGAKDPVKLDRGSLEKKARTPCDSADSLAIGPHQGNDGDGTAAFQGPTSQDLTHLTMDQDVLAIVSRRSREEGGD